MATREAVMTALLAVLQGAGDFKTVSRRNRSPESIGQAQSPALFLLDAGETYERPASNLPPKRFLLAMALFYNDVGKDQNAIPASAINDALDQLDALMAPDDRASGRFTLGGLVQSCMIDGEVKKAPGDVTGKSVAAIPLKILLP